MSHAAPCILRRRVVPVGRHGERGFALLEILVAFVILAVGLGAFSTAIVVAMHSDGRMQSSRVGLRLAQSRLEAAGVTEVLAPGQREGRTTNNYQWLETITAVRIGAESPPQPAVAPAQPAPDNGLAAFWVEVAVRAADGTVTKLGALKLATGAKL
jgi:general secretion pathway protein I